MIYFFSTLCYDAIDTQSNIIIYIINILLHFLFILVIFTSLICSCLSHTPVEPQQVHFSLSCLFFCDLLSLSLLSRICVWAHMRAFVCLCVCVCVIMSWGNTNLSVSTMLKRMTLLLPLATIHCQ